VTTLEAIGAELPTGYDALRAEAHAEGYRFLDRLADDWASGAIRFDRPGEALLAARCDDVLAGIGGLTVDPIVPGALRVRRFYVSAPFRWRGVGRRLASALLERALRKTPMVTVNAATGSILFWEALGFVTDPRDGHTHVLAHVRRAGMIGEPIGRRPP
jgi:GNAT superfamily N-acetyltransferase